jgi:hypothetical protein
MRPRSFRVAPPNDDELLAVESFGFAPQAAVSRRIGPVRLSPLACPGARHRRANPFSRDRQRLLPGNPSGDTVQAMQPLLRARVRRQPVRRPSGLSSRRPRVGVGPRPPRVLNLRAAWQLPLAAQRSPPRLYDQLSHSGPRQEESSSRRRLQRLLLLRPRSPSVRPRSTSARKRARSRPHTCSLSKGTPVLSAPRRAHLASEVFKPRAGERIRISEWQATFIDSCDYISRFSTQAV